jgi:hypothetical protein
MIHQPAGREVCVQRQEVSSSTIRSIGYDFETFTLEVEFASGHVYQYFDVPDAVYAGLMAAPSHGKYLDAHVKKGGFRYRRI